MWNTGLGVVHYMYDEFFWVLGSNHYSPVWYLFCVLGRVCCLPVWCIREGSFYLCDALRRGGF